MFVYLTGSVQYFFSLLISLLLIIRLSPAAAQVVCAAEKPFHPGEWLEYQVYYGFVHAGTATMCVDKQLHQVSMHPCYRVQVKGVSSNGLEVVGISIADTWESYLDKDLLQPRKFLSYIHENNYIRKEQIDFDYQSNQARIAVAESTNNMKHEVCYYPIPSQKIQDLVSGYYSLRAIDATKLRSGDRLMVSVLHGKQIYENIVVLFLGKQIIVTKLGKVETLVFTPLIPTAGGIFSAERPVEIFISNDANKIPLKLKINLVVGAAEIELSDYKGLKEAICFQKQ